MSETLFCTLKTWNSHLPIEKLVTFHDIQNQNVSKNSKFAVNPCTHNCTEVCFLCCYFDQFPSLISIMNHCPQITSLVIQDSNLFQIEADNLKGYENLKDLRIQLCEIEYLPGDLFKYTQNLEIVSFFKNKIKSVGENLLTPLRSLKYFNLCDNLGINYCFSSFTNQGSLQELNSKLKELKSYSDLRKEIAALNTRCKKLEDELNEARDVACKSIEALRKQVQQMHEAAKSLVVKVNGKEFRVQKKVLKAHSKVIEKLIDENPENDVLELTKLSEAVFTEILNFIHLGYAPNENVDLVELFGASCQLEIEALTQIVARILHEKVNPENALKVLILCNKYKNHEQLRTKAFDEFKKNFPHFTINPDFQNQPHKLKQLSKAKVEVDKLLTNK